MPALINPVDIDPNNPDDVAWNCLIDGCAEERPGTQILLAGLTPEGQVGLYDLGCAEDIWKHPGFHDGEVLVGTHRLSNDVLKKVIPNDLDTYDVDVWQDDCRAGTCNGRVPVLIVATDPEGGFHLLCVECALDIQKNPDEYCNVGFVLHGTHILTDETLQRIFPGDYTND